MARPMPRGGSSKPRQGMPPLVTAPAPLLGGYKAPPAVQRRAARPPRPTPRPVVSRPVAPRPPPVVVPNNQGQMSRPRQPAPVAPGPVRRPEAPQQKEGPGGQPLAGRNRGRIGMPSVSVPPPAPPPPVMPGPIPEIEPEPFVDETEYSPDAPGLDEFLGTDTDYLGVQSSLQQELARFQAEQTSARTSGAASFAQRLRELQEAQGADEGDLQEDFAARGLGRSGSYADALGQLQKQYLGSQGNLKTEQSQWEADFGSQLADYQAQQQLALQQAQQEAIARRAAMYGLA